MKGVAAFKRWFGASKVRDSDGSPLPVYHGTTHDFSSFTLERGNVENFFGAGFYFTSDPEDASRKRWACKSGVSVRGTLRACPHW